MSQEEAGEDPLHIGNLIGIHGKNGYTKGRVIYRDLEMLRIMPDEVSDRAVEFPMEEDGTAFAPALGVTEIEVFERRDSAFYVDFLGARVGELLEFFTVDGAPAAESGRIAEVLKNEAEGEEEDSIRLVDGRVLDFNGVGPPEPIIVIRVRTAINAPAAEVAVEAEEPIDDTAAARQQELLELLGSVLPSAAVEIIPTAERTYPDSMQREGLFQDLIADLKKQTVRKVRAIEREVDLAVALKNKSIQRETSGRIIGSSPYLIATVSDAVAQGVTPAAIPIVQAARVLNLDDAKTDGYSFKVTDVSPRSFGADELSIQENATRYLDGAAPEAIGGLNTFYAYTHNLLGGGLATLQGATTGTGWSKDQDVFRTASLDHRVQGLSSGLPKPSDKEGMPVSLGFLVSDVTNRAIRVLGTDSHTHLKTGNVHVSAPSDPNVVTGYVMLPPKAALKLRPPTQSRDLPMALLYSAALEADNLPTIAATLSALYSREAGSPQNAWTLAADAAETTDVATWLQTVLRYTVHPVDSLGPRGPYLLSLLDTMGLGTTDLAPAVAEVVKKWVSQSQKTWISLMKARRKEIQAALDTEPARTFQSVVGVDAPLWAALRSAESLTELLADIERRNPSIADAPTLRVASLLVEAQGDATPIVWAEIAKLDSRELAGIDVVTATAALAASRAYTLRRAALRSRDLLAMHAEPEVNPCPHASRLEAVRNVSDVLERSRLLRAFIEEFQGAKASTPTGEWITCVLCKKNCVCYHELMELEALAQPARMDTIQKQILIQYGGDRYEGKIICKNCGQGLQDIDYDEHVEFDDDGRPIQQSSVLTDEQMGDDAKPFWTGGESKIVFESQSHQEIAEALTDLLNYARLTMPPEIFRRCVNYADIYVGRRAPDEAKYTAMTEKKAKSASTKFKKTTGVSGVAIDLPTYTETIDQLRVSALIALVTIAVQTEDVTMGTPLPRCGWSRGGFPLNPTAKPDGPGSLLYMACAAADIITESKYKRKPWTSQLWVGDVKAETRQRKALAIATAALMVILGMDPKAAALSFTPELRMILTKAQTDTVAARERALVSLTDELPVGFRPEPRPSASASASEKNPLPAIKAALAAGNVRPGVAAELGAAVHQTALATITGLHADAVTSHNADMCCLRTVAEVETVTNMDKPLMQAAQLLRWSNTSAPTTGTHLWPMLETPRLAPIEQDIDDGVLFKLFLKFCYNGPAVGKSHEFSVGNICRQCGLDLGTPFDLIDFGKDGAAILAAQQGSLRIEVTRVAFDALSDAARRRKLIRPLVSGPAANGLADLMALCAQRPQTAAIANILDPILAAPVTADEMGRINLWSPLSAHMDELVAAADINTTMLDILTEDPFIEGPRVLQEYWCAKALAAGVGYAVTKVTGARWFKISKEHNEIINGILNDNAAWFSGGINESMRPILTRIAQILGPLLSQWIKSVRPDVAWSIQEAQLLLRTLVVQVWHDALMPTSWMYAEVAAPAERAKTVSSIRAWTTELMDFKRNAADKGHKRGHVQRQFLRFSKEEVKRILQQRAELERTSVVEEFENIKDDDQRAAELIKKQFRIGRWGVGKNLQKYDSDLFEFENEQRKRMGIMDDPVAADAVAPGAGAGAGPVLVEPEDGYAVEQGADGDDY
jgi:hypothetical protein